jgi:phosphoribosylaminoimidazole-succinocarboxamide synthase
VGEHTAAEMEEKSIAVYNMAREYALDCGLIIADTKFEYGIDNGKLVLIDELLTPDSSRFWDKDLYEPGRHQPSFDKQPVRDWLEASGWDKKPPAPELPPDVVEATSKRYVQAYEKLTGRKLAILE